MKHVFLLLLLASSLLWASSCHHNYYAPSGHNVPLLQEKNEGRFSLTRSQGEHVKGVEAQGAYSPTNHLGIMAAYYGVNRTNLGYGSYAEGGIGLFNNYYKHMVAECYAGLGNGKVFNDFGSNRYIKNSFTKFFIQPAVGFTGRYVDIAASVRISKLGLYNLSYNQTGDTASGEYSAELAVDYTDLLNNRTPLLLEPGLTLRAGWKYFKLQLQYSVSAFASGDPFKADRSNFNIGLYFIIARESKPAFELLGE